MLPWRVRRSVRVARGVRLNFGKRGTSVTLGRGPAHVTYSAKGKRVTLSAPGTGISYSEFTPAGHHDPATAVEQQEPIRRREHTLPLMACVPIAVLAAVIGWLMGRW